jgi:hypothetical protein
MLLEFVEKSQRTPKKLHPPSPPHTHTSYWSLLKNPKYTQKSYTTYWSDSPSSSSNNGNVIIVGRRVRWGKKA